MRLTAVPSPAALCYNTSMNIIDDDEEWLTEDEAIAFVMEKRDCSEEEAILWLDRLKCEMPESYRSEQ